MPKTPAAGFPFGKQLRESPQKPEKQILYNVIVTVTNCQKCVWQRRHDWAETWKYLPIYWKHVRRFCLVRRKGRSISICKCRIEDPRPQPLPQKSLSSNPFTGCPTYPPKNLRSFFFVCLIISPESKAVSHKTTPLPTLIHRPSAQQWAVMRGFWTFDWQQMWLI